MIDVKNKLTIIVPAWKSEFLRQALQSIADQTDQSFECIIFDDAAPREVGVIAAEFPAFRYHRFDVNMGGKSLILHWNRCLEIIDSEWVWIFSDDDVMSSDCVQSFRSAQLAHADSAVYQFPVDMMSADLGRVLWSSRPPACESAEQFVAARMQGSRLSCVPDHVFHLPTLRNFGGGFIEFPLAWNSDDATWALLGRSGGLAGIPGGRVFWRQSGLNISSDRTRQWEKLDADIAYLKWLAEQKFLVAPGREPVQEWLAVRLIDLYRFRMFDVRRIYTRLPKEYQPVIKVALVYRFRSIARSVKRRLGLSKLRPSDHL